MTEAIYCVDETALTCCGREYRIGTEAKNLEEHIRRRHIAKDDGKWCDGAYKIGKCTPPTTAVQYNFRTQGLLCGYCGKGNNHGNYFKPQSLGNHLQRSCKEHVPEETRLEYQSFCKERNTQYKNGPSREQKTKLKMMKDPNMIENLKWILENMNDIHNSKRTSDHSSSGNGSPFSQSSEPSLEKKRRHFKNYLKPRHSGRHETQTTANGEHDSSSKICPKPRQSGRRETQTSLDEDHHSSSEEGEDSEDSKKDDDEGIPIDKVGWCGKCYNANRCQYCKAYIESEDPEPNCNTLKKGTLVCWFKKKWFWGTVGVNMNKKYIFSSIDNTRVRCTNIHLGGIYFTIDKDSPICANNSMLTRHI